MRRYLIAPKAQQDLEDIFEYIAAENEKAARALLQHFTHAMDLLASNPLIGHVRSDITRKPVRFWSVRGHYQIVYEPSNPLKVARVVSSYRNLFDLDF